LVLGGQNRKCGKGMQVYSLKFKELRVFFYPSIVKIPPLVKVIFHWYI